MTETGLIPATALRRRPQNRGRSFVEVPAELNTNSENDVITSSVIAWSFYPKLLVRDGKGWRNVSNSQTITLHPTSVNKTNNAARYLSYYSIMQSASRNLNALSTSVVHELPLLLLAGDAEMKLHAGVVTIDGNRLRFSVKDWKTAVALKVLREKLEEVVEMKLAGSKKGGSSERARKWMEIFEMVCGGDDENKKGG
jgi:ATP-dependent RNA helicase DHX29